MKSQLNHNQILTAPNYQQGWKKAQAEYERQRTQMMKLAQTSASAKNFILKTVILFCCFCCQFAAYSQNLSQTIWGKVIDRESQAPLIGASISITSLNPVKGSITDADDNFKLEKVPVSRHTLKINYVGYEEQTIPELLIGSGKELVITVGLIESIRQMDEVVITAQPEKGKPLNDMATLSARSISMEETKRYAASVNDPARAALSYAGVATTDDGGNEIVVRGNSPKGILWRLEGIEAPNPNHFGEERTSGGGIRILSVNMIDNSDFFTGAFPTEYGNALLVIFDMKLRTGNNEKREHAFQVGVLEVDFATEGPIKKNYQ